MRLWELDTDHSYQPFADILPGEVLFDALQEIGVGRILVDRPSESGFKPNEVCSSLVRVDVIGKGEQTLGISIVILEGYLHIDLVLYSLDVDGFRMDTILIFIQKFDEGEYPPFVKEFVTFFRPFILNTDEKSFI